MKRLATYDREDYNPELPRTTKRSARAIIVKDSRIALLYSTKYEFYCFPGGAIEEDETLVEALVEQKLTQSEQESGYQLTFVFFDEAIKQNERGVHIEPKYTEAETYVLKLLKDEY